MVSMLASAVGGGADVGAGVGLGVGTPVSALPSVANSASLNVMSFVVLTSFFFGSQILKIVLAS
jgi:hypothetical protein